MKHNLTVRGILALLFTTICFLGFPAPAYGGGNKEPKAIPQSPEWSLTALEPSEKPEWVTVVPKSDTDIYFVGTSQMYDTPANARDNARENARTQVLEYYGQVIEKQAVSLSSVSGSTRDTLASYVVREEEIKSFAQNVVSEVATVAYATETYINSKTNKAAYIVYTLHKINRQKAEIEIADFAKNISMRYTAAFSQWGTLKAAMETYALIVKSLEQNPLHRIMAFYETPNGKAGLYEYSRLQINELANSLSVEAIPFRTVSKNDNLDTVVKLQSSQIPFIGPFNCRISVQGMNKNIPVVNYTVTNDNSFLLTIKTNSLDPGSYNVQIETLMNQITGGIAKNTSGGFSFEVTPIITVLNSRNAVEAGIKRAVDALATRLPGSTETFIGPFTLTGVNAPSELSLFLTEKVTHYATENQAKKYKIVEGVLTPGDTENRAVINGFFTKRNDRVDVTLRLFAADKTALGSQIFSISLAVLEQIPIAVEPLNVKTMIVLDDIVPAPITETISIEAALNTNSLTYKHGDELILTVTASKDSYFKIIHIDVDNQFQMIFPASGNDDNRLGANVSRTVFNTPATRRVLCGPYGAETLVVVASPVQFPNIEQEYNQPWRPLTETAIKAAIAGAGEARYTINILKPHTEYEYAKPDNMIALYQSIRDDAAKQKGYFEGNEASGFYIIGNVRGSYLVTRPDTIQFASYSLDVYNGNTPRATRGQPYNFSFAKPQNISQAIQAVRSGIEKKGGTFNGNEQQGNFRASGITGQYRISDRVDVTISEKPFIVPNSLIENEVKNFFGVR
jgi:predicted small secreted protein